MTSEVRAVHAPFKTLSQFLGLLFDSSFLPFLKLELPLATRTGSRFTVPRASDNFRPSLWRNSHIGAISLAEICVSEIEFDSTPR